MSFALIRQLSSQLGVDEDVILIIVTLLTLAAILFLNETSFLTAFLCSYLISFNLCRPAIFIIFLVLFYQVGIVNVWWIADIGFSQMFEMEEEDEEEEEEEEEEDGEEENEEWDWQNSSNADCWHAPCKD